MKNLIFIFLLALIIGCKVNQKTDSLPAKTTITLKNTPINNTRPKPKKTWESELKNSFKAHYKTKVDLDKTVAHVVLGGEILLQQDVMAPMAKEIIADWGVSNWNGFFTNILLEAINF